ncbi:MAG: outer membrane protein transport protein [Acidobacteriota bacterium]
MTKKILIAALAALAVLPSIAPANGLNLNSLGSRAQAMGGAFVGVADDFSAVFWNPAGAAWFRQTTYGFFATDLMPKTSYGLSIKPGFVYIPEYPPPAVDARTRKANYLGFLGAYYRPVGRKVVVGLGFGTPSGMGTKWNGADFADLAGGTTYDWSSKIWVFSLSPLVAVKLGDRISVGATVNIQYGNFSLKMPAGSADLGEGTVDLGQYEENMNGWAVGATFGVLARPSDRLSLGLTVRTPSTMTYKGSALMSYLPMYGLPGASRLERKMTWPLWIAGGVAFRPVPRLVLSADVQWTQWSKLDHIATDYLDPAWAAIMTANGNDVRAFDWADRTQLRIGAEFKLNATTALRAGCYHDPAPGPASTLNVFLPNFTYNTVCLGLGKTLSGGLQLDFGLEYYAGRERVQDSETYDIRYGMHIVVPSVSVSYKF